MTTKRLVPRSNKDGGIGSQDKPWLNGYFKETHAVGSMFYPTTTSLARPNNVQTGQIFFDTTINGLIIWDGTKWIELTNPISFALNVLTVTTDGEYGIGGQVGGGGIYSKGQQVTLTATADQHYSFVRWSGDLTELAQELERITTVNMTDSFNIFAEFAVETYTLTLQAGPNGSIVSGSGSYPYSTYAEIEANPDPGYDFTGWSSNVAGSVVDPSSAKTQVFVDADMNITASFALKPYEIFTNIFGSGEVVIQNTATYNSQVVIEKNPSPGYDNNNELTKIRDRSGQEIEVLTKADGRQFFNMPNSDVFVDVFFDPITYNIVDESDDNTSISITKTTANVGDKIYFSVNFPRGYEQDGSITVQTLSGSTINLTAEDSEGVNFSFIMPADQVYLRANSALVSYEITLNEEPSTTATLNARTQTLSEYSNNPEAFITSANYGNKVFIDIVESAGFKFKSASGIKNNGGFLSVAGFHKPGIHEYGMNLNYDYHRNYDPRTNDNSNVHFYMPEDDVTLTLNFEEHIYSLRADFIPIHYFYSYSISEIQDSILNFTYYPSLDDPYLALKSYGNTSSTLNKGLDFQFVVSSGYNNIEFSSKGDTFNNGYIELRVPLNTTILQLKTFLESSNSYNLELSTNISDDYIVTAQSSLIPGVYSNDTPGSITINKTDYSAGDDIEIILDPDPGYKSLTDEVSLLRMDNGQPIEHTTVLDESNNNLTVIFNAPDAGVFCGFKTDQINYIIDISDSSFGTIETSEFLPQSDAGLPMATVDSVIELTHELLNSSYELVNYEAYYTNEIENPGQITDFEIVKSSSSNVSIFSMPAGDLFITPNFMGKNFDIVYRIITGGSLSPDLPSQHRYDSTFEISKNLFIPDEGAKLYSLNVYKYEQDTNTYPSNKGDLITTLSNLTNEPDDYLIQFSMPNYKILIEADFVLDPVPDFIISPESTYYFGDTVTFTDVSTAPAGDGKIASATYTNDSGLSFTNTDTAIRVFTENIDTASYLQVNSVNGSTSYPYGDYNQEWTIIIDFESIPSVVSEGLNLLSRGWHNFHVDTYGEHASPQFYDGTSRLFGKSTYTDVNKKLILTSTGTAVYFGSVHDDGVPYYEGRTNVDGSLTTTPTELLRLFSSHPDYTPSHHYTRHQFRNSWTGLIKDIGFMTTAITADQRSEFFNTNIPDLSFYGSLQDHIACGSKVYPSLDGEKGVISAELKNSIEGQFQFITSLTLPSGSPGDTTGSVDVTLTVTDNQGITKETTKTIEYGLVPLEEPEISSLEKFVTTDDGLNILGTPSITSVETEVVQGGKTITNQLL
jgi:hypothetical protein